MVILHTYKMIIAVLLLVCILLLIGIIGMAVLVVTKKEPPTEKPQKDEKTVVLSMQQQDLPVYPRQNPVYQSQRSTPRPEFQQVGTLIYEDGDEPIVLPLFGRPMPTRNDRWEYYTATDKQYMLKIPIVFEEKDCSDELGCREVYSKDTVFIPAYKKEFKVNLYKYRDQISN